MRHSRKLCVVVIYPGLLGTYGDAGNALVLRERAALRAIACEIVDVEPGERLPYADIYLLGGGEDAKQMAAAQLLIAEGTLTRAVAAGATVLGVCAGYQLLGRSFAGHDQVPHRGLGILDVTTAPHMRRAVGEVVARPAGGIGLPMLVGFENHGGATEIGPDAQPLAAVLRGTGNGDRAGTEGATSGQVVGTYLHGPVLALNPALADVLLSWAVGYGLPPVPDQFAEAARRQRLSSRRGRHPRLNVDVSVAERVQLPC